MHRLMSTHEISMQNFEDAIEKNSLVLLDFWAEWCGPCKTLGPVFETLAADNPDIYFGKVDVEKATDLAEAFHVRGVPTLMGFHGGELVFELSGLPPPEKLLALLETLRTSA